ncbi:MAG: hypothetical protein ABI824_14970 [Acidobacteriota bacterium]
MPQANGRVVWTLFLVFAVGVGTGMLAMRYGLHTWLHGPSVETSVPAYTLPANATPEARAAAAVEQFRERLNLSADQTTKISAIIKDYNQYFDSVQAQIEDLRLREQIEDLRSTGKERILEILNADQKAKFEQMTAAGSILPQAPRVPGQ